MQPIDKVVFGDNQFFGINHMSQEKAQQLAEKFHNIKNIYRVYDYAFEAGIKGIMLNSNDRAGVICDYFREHESKFQDLAWYPSIPYPHKYANLVAEKGIFPTINEVLFKNNSASGILSMVAKGSSAILSKDAIKLMQMLIDLEMKIFRGLNVKVVFLQNIVTDLMLGYNTKVVFEEYCNYIKEKYNALPGLLTMNLPFCISKLKEWEIEEVVICSSINKIGYLMSPSNEAYEKVISSNDTSKYQIMAMSTLASGAIPVKEAMSYVTNQNIQSVVFGSSTRGHILETTELLK